MRASGPSPPERARHDCREKKGLVSHVKVPLTKNNNKKLKGKRGGEDMGGDFSFIRPTVRNDEMTDVIVLGEQEGM